MQKNYMIDTNRILERADEVTYTEGNIYPDRILKEHDFIYVVNGSIEIYENDTVYVLYPDDVILLHAGIHHYGKTPCKTNTSLISLRIKRNALDSVGDIIDNRDQFCPKHPELLYQTQPIAKQNTYQAVHLDTIIHCQSQPHIKDIFQSILDTGTSNSVIKASKITHLIDLLLCDLSECIPSKAIAIDAVTSQIVTMIQQNPQLFYTNKELSKYFFVCDKTLNNHFKTVYSMSIYEYQIQYKMELVRISLMNHPKIKLSEMATKFGFCDAFHLSKLFKKQYGVSPREYQVNYKQAVN